MIDAPNRYIFPLFRPSEKVDRPEVYGSAVLIKVDRFHFLISAAHCFDRSNSTIYFSDEGKLKPLEVVVHSNAAPGGDRSKDKIDIAVCSLPIEFAKSLEAKFSFLRIGDILIEDLPSPSKKYRFVGFPSSQSKVNFSRRRIGAQLAEYSLFAVGPSKMKEFGWDSSLHVAGVFEKKNMASLNNERFTAPDPTGISGGGVWISEPGDGYRLVGVAIDWDGKNEILVGVRFGAFVPLIKAGFPETVPYLRESKFLRISIDGA